MDMFDDNENLGLPAAGADEPGRCERNPLSADHHSIGGDYTLHAEPAKCTLRVDFNVTATAEATLTVGSTSDDSAGGATPSAGTEPLSGSAQFRGHAPKVKIEGPAQPIRLARAPAAGLERLLRFVLTPGSFQRMVAPAIADAQHEYYEDLLRKNYAHARWVMIRLRVLICWNVICAVVPQVTRLFKSG
jgi:hypothetical protein